MSISTNSNDLERVEFDARIESYNFCVIAALSVKLAGNGVSFKFLARRILVEIIISELLSLYHII